MNAGRRDNGDLALADEQVPILLACRLIGMHLPDLIADRALKVHCPFGELYHNDGGIEPAMRVYVTDNRVHCFAGCGSYRPVKLLAHALGIPRISAARELLERVGISRQSREKRWAEALTHTEPLDKALLAEALKTYCRRTVPDWDRRQYEAAPARTLALCLDLLDRVHTAEQAQRWLAGCKRAIDLLLAQHTPTD